MDTITYRTDLYAEAMESSLNPDGTVDFNFGLPTREELAELSDMEAMDDWLAVVDAFTREVYGEVAL